jgi:uncharacterized protein YcnI
MIGRVLCAAILAFAACAASAEAHVTISPATIQAGAFDELVFRCPNERAAAATTALTIQLPQDNPIGSVEVRALPGWQSSVTMRKLTKPIETQHGEITSAVDTITWKGGTIPPGEYQDFAILAGPIPSSAHELVFKALQTYSNGEVVRWIQLRHPNEPEPPNPAPILKVHH